MADGAPPPREALEAMVDALAHRGPDDSGIAVEGNVGLINTRLAIIDPGARGHQPMTDPSGDWTVAYNGEVFNHAELRAELASESFTGTSDTETVAAALARWGERAPARFDGMFALAGLDRRGGRLLLTRDRVGVKPLYVARDHRGIWFASEPAALLAAGVTAEVEPRRVARAIGFTYANGRTGTLTGVTRVEPGTVVSVHLDGQTITETPWFEPSALVSRARQADLASLERSDLVDLLERELRGAVHASLMADVEVGVTCSGGLDSIIVLALAREALPGVRAFAASYAGDGHLEEGPAARRVAEALGVELEVVEVTASWWRARFVGATLHYGGPLPGTSPVVVSGLAELARRAGVKALLSGEGADELFAGYGFAHQSTLREFLPLTTLIRRRLERESLRGSTGVLAAPVRLAFERARRARVTPFPDSDDDAFEVATLAAGARAYAHHSGARRRLEAELIANLGIYLPQLLDRMDRMGMQQSVEIRVPFLERGVIELAMNLPLEARTSPRVKGVLRDVGRRLLGRRIAHRPKVYGMGHDARGWIEEAAAPSFLLDGQLRELMEIDRPAWAGIVATAPSARTVRLWSAEIWCRSVAGESPAAIERELWPQGP